MRRLVWVTAERPGVECGGGGIRQAHLLRALGEHFEVSLLTADGVEDPGVLAACERVVSRQAGPRLVRGPRAVRRLEHLRRSVAPGGPAETRAAQPARAALREPLRRELATGTDLVVLQHLGTGGLLGLRRHGGRARWAVELHQVPSGTARQQLAVTAGARQRWLLQRELAQARARERGLRAAADLLVAVSDDDAGLLPPGPTAVVPNGVDRARFRPSPLPSTPRVLFSGTLGYLPNVDGLTWFVREVWPAVRAAVPDAELDVVGRRPVPELLAALRVPGVRTTVDVPDVRPHLARCRTAVVPLRLGTGTRLKALEALASARPVVGTTVGLAGLGLRDGHDALVRDDAAGTAAAVVRLLRDDALAGRLATAGEAVAGQHDWRTVGERYAERLLDLVA